MKSGPQIALGVFVGALCFIAFQYYLRYESLGSLSPMVVVSSLVSVPAADSSVLPGSNIVSDLQTVLQQSPPESAILVANKSLEIYPPSTSTKSLAPGAGSTPVAPMDVGGVHRETIGLDPGTSSGLPSELSPSLVLKLKNYNRKTKNHNGNVVLFNVKECIELKSAFKMGEKVPDSSPWGTMPPQFQRRYTDSQCAAVSSGTSATAGTTVAPLTATPTVTAINTADVASLSDTPRTPHTPRLGKLNQKHIPNPSPPSADADETEDAATWCNNALVKYKVKPQASWGMLPPKGILAWKRHRCDLVFTASRMAKMATINCTKEGGHLNDKTLPLIAVMAGSSTRKTRNPSTKNLALFNFLLPSLTKSVDCGFRYMFVIGYDLGDAFYDTEEGRKQVSDWFRIHVETLLARNGISIYLTFASLHNTLKKPGPIFNAMARHVYEDHNADYYYRVNDDTELVDRWPMVFVKALRSLSPPYGVVGPTCEQGNRDILTHDFVHKTHMQVFEMNYYPPVLVDWWMDDWVSFVYGRQRSFKARNVKVIHHTGAHGQRYEVDRKNEKLLPGLLKDGKTQIRKWMLKHNTAETQLQAFDKDTFGKFVLSNVPN